MISLTKDQKIHVDMIERNIESAAQALDEAEAEMILFVRSLIEQICDKNGWGFISLVHSLGFIDLTKEPEGCNPKACWIHWPVVKSTELEEIVQKYLGTINLPMGVYRDKKWN